MIKPSKKDQIIQLKIENPELMATDIANRVGCNKRYARKILHPSLNPTTPILTKEEQKEIKRLQRLEENIKVIQSRKKIIEHMYGKRIRIGIISDNHAGSIYENPQMVETLYKIFKREKVEAVYHAGDFVEGEHMFRGQEYERYISGGDKLVEHVIETYPNVGLTTFAISGNHDRSYWKVAGIDIVKMIADKRDDITYLGRDLADIKLAKNITMRLFHPDGGTAYALSYRPQKIVESLSGGEKPNILVIGHYHKAEMIPQYRNICIIQAGTTMSQSDYMKRKALAAHLGGWILDFQIDRGQLISKFKAEFISFYEG